MIERNGKFGAGNEVRTRDLNLGKIQSGHRPRVTRGFPANSKSECRFLSVWIRRLRAGVCAVLPPGEKRTGGRVRRAFQGAGWSLRHPLRAWGAAFSGGLSFWDHLLLVVITGVVLGALLCGALVVLVEYQAEILTFLATF